MEEEKKPVKYWMKVRFMRGAPLSWEVEPGMAKACNPASGYYQTTDLNGHVIVLNWEHVRYIEFKPVYE